VKGYDGREAVRSADRREGEGRVPVIIPEPGEGAARTDKRLKRFPEPYVSSVNCHDAVKPLKQR
jgi:hypothetical protein